MLSLARCGLFGFAVLVATVSVRADGIDADPEKVYHLTEHHGPWMVMVASFQNTGTVPDESTSPAEAAHALVLELRQHGLPAYVYEMDSFDSPVLTTNRLGVEEIRRPSHRYRATCVLAGNYPSLEDAVGQATLEWIKHYRIESELFGEVMFNPTPGQPGPLSGAFMTVNPLLTPEELSARQRAQDFRQLAVINQGVYSLLENPGSYSLVIATFRGRTIHQGLDSDPDEEIDSRSATVRALEMISGGMIGEPSGLEDAARSATQLAVHLNVNENVEAYVWHDQFASFVTVGSFASTTDPAIDVYRQRFSVAPQVDPNTGRMYGFTQIPTDYGSSEYEMIVYDSVPQLMPVPRSGD